jgi:sodium/hydrogen antiporter
MSNWNVKQLTRISEQMGGLESYELGLFLLGAGLVLAYWIPRFISGREPAASALVIAGGATSGLLMPDLARDISPMRLPVYWEHISELALVIGLFGTGLRIDRLKSWAHWRPTFRLLVVAMPMTIALIWWFGVAVGGLTLAGGLILAAALAPTDPLLASEVQVGPPLEGGEHPVRFTLTTEAGLNDGLAFPFIYLGLAIAAAGAVTAPIVTHWVAVDLLYRTVMGLLGGAVVGWVLGKIMFDYPQDAPLAESGSGVVAVAGALLAYSVTEAMHGYGFIAAFFAGMVLRRSEARHEFHRTLHSFTETTEAMLTAILLFALGLSAPYILDVLDWKHAAIGLLLVFVVRPASAWISLVGTPFIGRERFATAFYGIRGIGSIYYMAYVATHMKLDDRDQLWSTITFTIMLSTIVHGLTAGIAMDRATKKIT